MMYVNQYRREQRYDVIVLDAGLVTRVLRAFPLAAVFLP
jgi:hypothetical protein